MKTNKNSNTIFAKRMARQLKAPELSAVAGGMIIYPTQQAQTCWKQDINDYGEPEHPDFLN